MQITRRTLAFLLLLLSSSCGSSPGGSSPASGGATAATGGGSNLNISPGACPDAGAASPTDAGTCVAAKPRSFTRDVIPLFNSCAGEICHSFGAGAIAQQIGIPSVECCGELQMIERGNPERSYVLQKLRGNNVCGGSQMPLDQPPFNSDDLQVISDWICQGAGTTP